MAEAGRAKRRIAGAAAVALWLLGSAVPGTADVKDAGLNGPIGKSGQLISVKLNGKWGLLDRHGKIVIPIIQDFIEFPASGDIMLFDRDGNATADATGRVFIPASRRNVWSFAPNGLAVFSFGNCYGLIDRQNRVKWEPVFSALTDFDGKSRYVARFQTGTGVLDLNGRWSIAPLLYSIGELAPNGLALAQTDASHSGFVDRDGNWIIPPGKFQTLWGFGENGLALAQFAGKWGFIDKQGQWVVPPVSEERIFWPDPDASGLIPMKVGGLWGLMARGGKFVVEPRFQEIGSFSEGFFQVESDGKWGIADRTGRVVIAPRYDSISDFHREGLAAVTLNGKSWMIDRAGRRVFGERFEAVGGFLGGGWAPAKSNGKWGAIDTKGQWLVKPAYDCVGSCFEQRPPPVYIGTRPICSAYAAKPRTMIPVPAPRPAPPPRPTPPHRIG